MKKFLKFLFGVVSIVSLACGAYYFFKKYICKNSDDEFDDFDDDLDDLDLVEDDTDSKTDDREYVSIHITSDEESKHEESESADMADEGEVE